MAVVYQLNKRDLPNVESVEEMTSYLGATPESVVEASAKTGVGVTANLNAATGAAAQHKRCQIVVREGAAAATKAPPYRRRTHILRSSR